MKTTKENEGTGSKVAAAIIGLASMPFDAWVIKVLWWWFVVPMGLHGITAAHAFGLTALVSCVRYRNADPNKDTRTMLERSIGAVAGPAILLGLGAIAHWLMRP